MNTASALKTRIEVANHKASADLVIKNGTIVNVFTGEEMKGDIAIVDGVIAGIGIFTDAKHFIDAAGQWIIPGLIDGHVHIESSMLTPPQFAQVAVQHGVTTVVTDPHEIGNVMGTEGIQFMLAQSKGLPVDMYVNLPSCVPATPFETSGARLEAEQLRPFYDNPNVLGLAEVMDFPALSAVSPSLLNKLADALDQGAHIDGHAAGILQHQLNLYMAAGIRTDHECINAEEAKQRLDLGMYLMIREGTVAKDLKAILPAVTPRNARRCLFVTDDKLIDDLLEEGSVDHSIRLAVSLGLDPITAVQMATINAAECFGLRDRGAVAPGYKADLVILDDLNKLSVRQVFKNGSLVYDTGRLHLEAFPNAAASVHNQASSTAPDSADSLSAIALSVRHGMKPIDAESLAIRPKSDTCHVIGIIPNSLVTEHLQEQVLLNADGAFMPSVERDQLKLAVIERHHATGNIGLGIVRGFQFTRGAIVSTVAHDSHNIICAGVSDADMLLAIGHVAGMNGGLAVAADGHILASLPLPIGGLMSDRHFMDVYEQMKSLNRALQDIGAPEHFNPFLTLSFLALPVIPHLKMTDLGLFDFESNAHIEIEA